MSIRFNITTAALAILILLILTAVTAPLLPIVDPEVTDLSQRLLPPLTDGHLLGTDLLGRDLLSRLIWGLRLSVGVALLATMLAMLLGSAVGVLAGYFRGWFDQLAMRGIDLLMAFPYLILALAIVAILGPGIENALLAIAVVNIPFFARITRGATLGLRRRAFIEAARIGGQSHLSILFREVLPNVFPVILVTATTTLGWMILETAGLSFLGLGAQPPRADLGAMLADGRKLMLVHPHVALLPGFLIFFLVLSLNLLGDALRDRLDPRLQSGATSPPSAVTQVRFASPAPEVNTSAAIPAGESPASVRPLLEVRGLSISFQRPAGRFHALRDLSFTLESGGTLAIVGESGSGKSITALSLTRLLATPPAIIESGEVEFSGIDLLRCGYADLRRVRGARIGYVFQDPLGSLHPLASVGEQVVEAITVHRGMTRGQARQTGLEWLERMNLPDPEAVFHALPHELSGGQRQRVGIAMAMVNEPELLIADEPTTALDVTVQKQILEQLDTMRREHDMAMILISHDLALVPLVCENVLVMRDGRMVESGPARKIMKAPESGYTRHLLDCIPRIGASGRRFPEEWKEAGA